jgi:sugar/nucleoside kinase (ribokinase family)
MMYDVICIGGATQDVFIQSEEFKIEKNKKSKISECILDIGQKINVDQLNFATGGGGTNCATAFSRMGFKTALISKVNADDYSGTMILKELRTEKVNVENIILDPKHQTGYAIALLTKNGDRTLLIFRGAGANLNPTDIEKEKIIDAKWLHVTSLGGNFETLNKIFNIAQDNGIKVFFNPGSAELENKNLDALLAVTDILLLNLKEAQSMTDETDIDKIFEKLTKKIPGICVVTGGANGAYAFDRKKIFKIPAGGSKPIDTTGAGDAFGSGFLAGILIKNDIQYALQLGIYNSDKVIQKIGAKAGLIKNIPEKMEYEVKII